MGPCGAQPQPIVTQALPPHHLMPPAGLGFAQPTPRCQHCGGISRADPGASGHLEHGVGQEGLQGPLLAVGLGLVVLQQLVEVPVLLAVRQDLQAVLVVPHELLVDVQHGQQDVEQVGCEQRGGREVGVLVQPPGSRPSSPPHPTGAPPGLLL